MSKDLSKAIGKIDLSDLSGLAKGTDSLDALRDMSKVLILLINL